MLFNRRAERMIIRQIDELSMDRIAPRKHDIENSIKWMYWSGTFSKRKHDKLLLLLKNKYTEVTNNHDKKVAEAMERDYKAFRSRYGLDWLLFIT